MPRPAQVRIDWSGPRISRKVERIVMERVAARMIEGERLARQTYQRNVGKLYPPASRPGEFPRRRPRSGRLYRMVKTNINRVSRSRIQLVITNIARSDKGKPYSAWLEHGTPGGQMLPRPHLAPTLAQILPRIKQLLRAK